MERITEDQVNRLVRFVRDRIPDSAALQGEARRTATALRLAADRQIYAVRFHRTAPPANGVTADVAAAAWNLLVALAGIWHDHPEFPADAAKETFEFDCDAPL
ncbi:MULTISPECIES: hypothetical protein [unclassified Streptomyces]|uniref:hypothetical protein n=1 Tax=unclassified Streptomyces TaxID=2593676 RepID=UPI002E299B95|nr:hypothetical protein [Streptomyces sp. NBC_01423]WSX95108.1 hypothetical protein OH827_33220 [Streptomyces sp. NBC_00891]WSY09588.1 hypothetical protein OG464_33225 [Streptomyces sp. NBC_00890]WSZ11208.1 hypothetical protein OG704_33225 [Streptomyces sp. NBC_00869]WSZ21286.1 hypothetical protein OG498_00340 [Streptomyces sp. NBC_00870]